MICDLEKSVPSVSAICVAKTSEICVSKLQQSPTTSPIDTIWVNFNDTIQQVGEVVVGDLHLELGFFLVNV